MRTLLQIHKNKRIKNLYGNQSRTPLLYSEILSYSSFPCTQICKYIYTWKYIHMYMHIHAHMYYITENREQEKYRVKLLVTKFCVLLFFTWNFKCFLSLQRLQKYDFNNFMIMSQRTNMPKIHLIISKF